MSSGGSSVTSTAFFRGPPIRPTRVAQFCPAAITHSPYAGIKISSQNHPRFFERRCGEPLAAATPSRLTAGVDHDSLPPK